MQNIIAEAVTITGSGVGLVTDTVVVNTVDINTMSIILAGNPSSINEGGTANFTVKLGAEPSPACRLSCIWNCRLGFIGNSIDNIRQRMSRSKLLEHSANCYNDRC